MPVSIILISVAARAFHLQLYIGALFVIAHADPAFWDHLYMQLQGRGFFENSHDEKPDLEQTLLALAFIPALVKSARASKD